MVVQTHRVFEFLEEVLSNLLEVVLFSIPVQPLCCPSHSRFLHNLMHLQNPSLLFSFLSRRILRWHYRQFSRVDVGFVLETYSDSFAALHPTSDIFLPEEPH